MDDWTGKDVVAHIAWWHDHSALVVESALAGRVPDEQSEPAGTVDEINAAVHRDHLADTAQLTRAALRRSFERLVAGLEQLSDEDLFTPDRWMWLDGKALVETILWDTSRHYEAHQEHLAALLRT